MLNIQLLDYSLSSSVLSSWITDVLKVKYFYKKIIFLYLLNFQAILINLFNKFIAFLFTKFNLVANFKKLSFLVFFLSVSFFSFQTGFGHSSGINLFQ